MESAQNHTALKMPKAFWPRFFLRITLPIGQTIMLMITGLALCYCVFQYRSRFHYREVSPPLLPITPQKIKDWGTSRPVEVVTGFKITNFPQFDVIENNFVFDGVMWFQFDPALISLDTISKFSIERGSIRSKSEPYIKIIHGSYFARYNVRIEFTSNLDYRMLPFDNHRIHIAVLNKFITPSEAVFKSSEADFSIVDGVFIMGWRPVKLSVDTGYEQVILDKFDPSRQLLNPKIIFSIDIERFGVEEIMLILLPTLLIFFIGLFSFAFHPSENPTAVLGLISASVASLISFKFVIQRMSPIVGYFTFSDIMFMVLLSISFFVFLFNLFSLRIDRVNTKLLIARSIIFVLIHLFIIAVWYYLLNFWEARQ